MANFTLSLQNHFDDMFENGREIIREKYTWQRVAADLEDYLSSI